MSTFERSVLLRAGDSAGAGVFPEKSGLVMTRELLPDRYKEQSWTTAPASRYSEHEGAKHLIKDPLIRLSAVREPDGKITVLQRWVGTVAQFCGTKMTAVITDATNPQNPSEEVELSADEISSSDLPLARVGATFYWTIGYRDSREGQRERISTLRFARQPRLSKKNLNRIFEQADGNRRSVGQ